MQNFRDLRVWKEAHALVLAVYRVTKAFPDSEKYGITSQLRRAAVSIPANIAEGSKRETHADYARFLNIAEGSTAEAEYFVILSGDLGYLSSDTATGLLEQLDHVARMLQALHKRVSRPSPEHS